MHSVKNVVLEIGLASSDTHRYFLESAMMLNDAYFLRLRKRATLYGKLMDANIRSEDQGSILFVS